MYYIIFISDRIFVQNGQNDNYYYYYHVIYSSFTYLSLSENIVPFILCSP
jgi:hypothetical protein